LVEKVRDEESRIGNFIRVFPRPESKAIYKNIYEDAGQEQWDERLHQALFGDDPLECSHRDYDVFHEQMIQTDKVTVHLFF
jgi:hypothetical protein